MKSFINKNKTKIITCSRVTIRSYFNDKGLKIGHITSFSDTHDACNKDGKIIACVSSLEEAESLIEKSYIQQRG